MLKSYQKEFLRKIHELTTHIVGLELLVIYGSYVRDELTSKSDVDFFALFHDQKALNEGEEILYSILTEECDRELELPASLYAVSEEEDIDKSFFYGVLTEGFIITPAISQYLLKVLDPSPQVIFTYSMDNLSPQKKVKINQILYGYTQKKKDKKYSYDGLLEHLNGERIRSGIMVSQDHEHDVERFMRENNLNYKKKVIFV